MEKGKHILCRRVTRNGVPCKNKRLWNSDYCLVHNTSQSRNWVIYVGILGSVASIIGFIYLFIPIQPKASSIPQKVPFLLTTDDGTIPVSSVFGGTYSVFEDRVEVTIDSASFENNSLDNQTVAIGFISGGLAIRSDVGHWRIILRADTAQAKVTVNPSSKAFLPEKIHMKIPYPQNTDFNPFHLVLAPMIQIDENRWESKPEWCAHSDQGIFKATLPH
jgi:hypothetical protein